MAQYQLPPLPYDLNALEASGMKGETLEYHYGKHHKAYVDNLNKALADFPEIPDQPIEELIKNLGALPESIRTAVRNNGGGLCNHNLFWLAMKPAGGGEPTGALADAINSDLGGFAAFKEAFSKAGITRFGSGWAWLVVKDGKLAVISTPNQDNPLMDGSGIPILGLDVWEHAYYIDYRNARPAFINNWLDKLVNWDQASSLYAAAK